VSCQTCDELLADYKDAVELFKDAVHKGQVARVGDLALAARKAARRGEICRDASDALIEHWRQDHRNFAAKAGSS
jgi:hypothetical protein